LSALRIYELMPDANRYLCVQPADLRYFHDRFDGRPLAAGWSTPPYEVLNRSKRVADFTSWQIGSKAFLASEKARAVLLELCPVGDLEFLPFDRFKRTDLYAVNVLRVEDFLDWQRTEFVPGADIPLRASWRRDLPPALPPLFKVSGGSSSYAAHALGRAAVDHGLTGLRLGDPAKNQIEQLRRREEFNVFPGL
jgi:hypothetical protein